MKPKEFFIELRTDNPSNLDIIAGTAYTTKFPSDSLHVREIIPLDWMNIWKEYNKFLKTVDPGEVSGNHLTNKIQELVEKALKGEL